MSARESILAAMGTLLGTVPGATFYRSREAAIARSESTAIVLEPEEESVELRTSTGALSVRTLTALVLVVARGQIPDQIADPVIQSLHAKLMADRTLGGLCALIIEHGTKWTFDEADLTAVTVEMRYGVRYMTNASDLSQLT
jgi:transcriptional antiterminator Rof (Rho-off)